MSLQTIQKQNNTANTPYKKLGFSYLDTAEIAITMKKLLMNYQMYYHKLRIFHWNVEGQDFFELHQEFEHEYKIAFENIDIVAERIRVFGLKPILTMKVISESSDIKEVAKTLTAMGMVREVLKDYEILHSSMLDVLNASLKIGDVATEQMVTTFIKNLEKRNWMFTSWCK